MLPNFLIIGAMKAGTSSPYHYVGDHSQVFMPEQKELQFFGRDDWKSSLPWYEAQCDAAREQLLVIQSENRKYRRLETLSRLFSNLVPATSDGGFYRTDECRERHPRLQRVRRAAWYRPALDAIPLGVRQAMWRRMEPLATWRVERRRGEISPDLRVELESRIRDDVVRLRGYMASDFDGWGIT